MEFNNEIDLPAESESKVEIKTLENHVFEALGYASMCWSETPKGVFDSEKASKCGEELMRHINTDVPHACKIVFKALREDPEYYIAWQATIAMTFQDEYHRQVGQGKNLPNYPKLRAIANQAAKNFLNLLIKPIEQ